MFTLQDLERAVETADYVALALPHTKETENVVGERFSKDENICGFDQRWTRRERGRERVMRRVEYRED